MMTFKRILASACCLLMAISFAGCQPSGEKAKITIDLETNPTTGYEWEVENDEKLKLLDTETVSSADESLNGAPSTSRFTFEPVSAGEASVKFTYKRSWEGGETAYTVAYTFTIDDKLNIKFDAKTPEAVDGTLEGTEFPDPVIK